ncbi:MAG TPA: zinc ribbon domain-containing protein [Myxococcota bacterium]|nr:zinc ribbon domain-containing protein [Myxococcota bacterium]
MPVYEYACEKCKHEFEAEQRISDEPLRTCPKCRARKVKRLISRTSFVLKGSGWYSDLYASPGAKKDADAKAGDAGDKAAASDAKSDSKSEAKSETRSEKPAAKSEGKSGPKAKGKSKAA